ncbi:protein-methionine-sulfoxide reductase heme-binding subunit MsrQ [Rhodobacteraceae bacterium]|nr:protein-methionine-sulfoxide reductase heme-binding subunit MsrQ [Paracoccaceae bacterium]
MQRINQAIGYVPAWLIYVLAIFPPCWFLYLGLTGGLGVEPIKALEHKLGEQALQILLVTLAVRPLREVIGINLLKHRRALGVVTFWYVFLHMLVWLVLDVGILSEIWADIVKRPYITVGMAALLLMVPLAVTSNNYSLRKLGPKKWAKLHRLMYPLAFLASLHFVMLAKGFQIEPLIYMGITLLLLLLRWKSLGKSVSGWFATVRLTK